MLSAILRGCDFAPSPVGLRPSIRFNQAAPDPPRSERRQHSDHVHPAPRGRSHGADEKPNASSAEEPNTQTTLHQSGAITPLFTSPTPNPHRTPRPPPR